MSADLNECILYFIFVSKMYKTKLLGSLQYTRVMQPFLSQTQSNINNLCFHICKIIYF